LVRHATALREVTNNGAALANYDVQMFWLPQSVGGLTTTHGRALYAGGWPDTLWYAGWTPTAERWFVNTWPDVGRVANWKLCLTATSGSEDARYWLPIDRVRVDCKF
jgi:hypothetical protein